MVALPDGEALARIVERDVRRLVGAMESELDAARARVERLGEVLHARSPQARVALARTREARARTAVSAIQRLLDRRRRRVMELAARLDAMSPWPCSAGATPLRDGGTTGGSSGGLRTLRWRFPRRPAGRGAIGAEVTRLDPPGEAD